jgi:hypothetical protein
MTKIFWSAQRAGRQGQAGRHLVEADLTKPPQPAAKPLPQKQQKGNATIPYWTEFALRGTITSAASFGGEGTQFPP